MIDCKSVGTVSNAGVTHDRERETGRWSRMAEVECPFKSTYLFKWA